MNDKVRRGIAKHYKVAYLTHEIQSVDETIHCGVGGLGVVAADHIIAAENVGFPIIACSLYPRKGYYKQALMGNAMGVEYVSNDDTGIVVSTGEFFTLPMGDMHVKVEILVLEDMLRTHTKVILLSTDLEENPEHVRHITRNMYSGKHATGMQDEGWIKMAQAFILGWGSRMAFEKLGITVDLWHLNESHAAFAQLYHLNKLLDEGYLWDKAVKATIASHVFTNHTVVGAGNSHHNMNIFYLKIIKTSFL